MDYNGMAECSYLKFFWRPICLQIKNTKTSDFIQGKKEDVLVICVLKTHSLAMTLA